LESVLDGDMDRGAVYVGLQALGERLSADEVVTDETGVGRIGAVEAHRPHQHERWRNLLLDERSEGQTGKAATEHVQRQVLRLRDADVLTPHRLGKTAVLRGGQGSLPPPSAPCSTSPSRSRRRVQGASRRRA